MSHECCPKINVMTDPCAAIAHGDLDASNYANFMSKGEFLLLLAQCGTTSAIVDLTAVANQILACCEASKLILIDIEEDTTAIDLKLQELIDLVTAGNSDLAAILVAVEAILVEAEAINANTDQIEALLQSILTIATSIETNTDDIETTLASILANQVDTDLFGDHVYASGVGAVPAGQYSAWTVVRTDIIHPSGGGLVVEGIPLYAQGDSTGEKAQPQFKVTAPSIVAAGAETWAWRTIS